MKRQLALLAALAALLGLIFAPVAQAHGGDEMAVQALKMQPARTLAQQALAELRVGSGTEEAATQLDAALESKDQSAIDGPLLRKATETLDGGNPEGAIRLLDEALSRPLGAASGKALHESGREFQPATGAQEVVAIVLGAAFVLVGAALLLGHRRVSGPT